jgi:Flp pilus assembly protein TadG
MKTLRELHSSESGATAVIFGLALLPLMVALGAAIDYTRAANVRASMQRAVDSAAIVVARDSAALSTTAAETRGRDFFAANFGKSDATLAPVTVTRDSKTVRVAASGTVPTAFMQIVGINAIPVSSEAVVNWGSRKIELALVLDNTGSMKDPLGSGFKIDELRKAANKLLDQAEKTSPEKDAIKISIVPFDTQVNVGNLLGGLDVSFDFGITKALWKGCVGDREQTGNYDVNDEAPRLALKDTLFPAVKCNGSLAELQPLTSDFAALRKTVAAMSPSGMTNITIGTTWGLKTLSSGSPLSEAAPYKTANLDKYMVVLTDGDNTQNRFTSKSSDIDARTRLACQSAKDAGIKVFTVLVGKGNANLLRDCAGNGGTYQEVKDAAAISAAFANILNDVLAIRLTQ